MVQRPSRPFPQNEPEIIKTVIRANYFLFTLALVGTVVGIYLTIGTALVTIPVVLGAVTLGVSVININTLKRTLAALQ